MARRTPGSPLKVRISLSNVIVLEALNSMTHETENRYLMCYTQVTFRSLEVQGPQPVNLGRCPQLAEECVSNDFSRWRTGRKPKAAATKL